MKQIKSREMSKYMASELLQLPVARNAIAEAIFVEVNGEWTDVA